MLNGSNEIGEKGFIQLVSPEGDVLGQRDSYSGYLDYHRERVWFVNDGRTVRFTKESDYVQPHGFTLLKDKNAIIKFYRGEDSENNELSEPRNSKCLKEMSAKDVDLVHSFNHLLGVNYWNAFCDGKFVGTSEA